MSRTRRLACGISGSGPSAGRSRARRPRRASTPAPGRRGCRAPWQPSRSTPLKPAHRRAIIFTPRWASTAMTSAVTLSLTNTQTTSTSSPTVSTVSGESLKSRNFTSKPASARPARGVPGRTSGVEDGDVGHARNRSVDPGRHACPRQRFPWLAADSPFGRPRPDPRPRGCGNVLGRARSADGRIRRPPWRRLRLPTPRPRNLMTAQPTPLRPTTDPSTGPQGPTERTRFTRKFDRGVARPGGRCGDRRRGARGAPHLEQGGLSDLRRQGRRSFGRSEQSPVGSQAVLVHQRSHPVRATCLGRRRAGRRRAGTDCDTRRPARGASAPATT